VKLVERIGWVALAAIAGAIINEILFALLNPPGTRANTFRAALPALVASIVVILCLLKAMGLFRSKDKVAKVKQSMTSAETAKSDAGPLAFMSDLSTTNGVVSPQDSHSRSEAGQEEQTTTDKSLWEAIVAEYDSPDDRDTATWASAFAEADGNPDRTKARYFSIRFRELKAGPRTQRQGAIVDYRNDADSSVPHVRHSAHRSEFEAASERRLMNELGITFDGAKYRCKDYEFDYLSDAVGYARRGAA
jgi:hypothetical protein